MQLLYKVGAGGVIHLKKVEEISREEADDGWAVQDEWLENHEVCNSLRVQGVTEKAEASREEAKEGESEDANDDSEEQEEVEDSEDEEEEEETEEEEEEEEEMEYLPLGTIPAITEGEWAAAGHTKPLNVVLETAKEWCEGRGILNIHWFPGDLKVDGRRTKAYHGECKRHRTRGGHACPYRLRARIATKEEMPGDALEGDASYISIEQKHDHEGDSDPDIKRREIVKSITKTFTAKQAEVELTKRGVKHKGKWRKHLENARGGWKRANEEPPRFDAEFQDTMRQFCASPPAGLQCFYEGEGWEISEHVTRIGFIHTGQLAEALQRIIDTGAVKFVIDGTYQTNVQRLVLVQVAPPLCGQEDSMPRYVIPML